MNSDSMKIRILIDYAGAAAEEIFLGYHTDSSMGSSDADFEKAIIHIKQYLILKNPFYSKTGLDEGIKSEMCSVSKTLYNETKTILLKNKDDLYLIKKKLYESEPKRISSEELKKFLNENGK